MTFIQQPSISRKATNSFVAMTPLNVYLEQVRNISDSARAKHKGLTYYPNTFGGLYGQQEVLKEKVVLQLIGFENTESE